MFTCILVLQKYIMEDNKYVHGYSDIESGRLYDQAMTLTHLLHHDTTYPAGHKVLEAGCGVGAQTIAMAKNSPCARFTSFDISEESVRKAKKLMEQNNINNVTFRVENLFNLPFESNSFDHVFVCFILEHIPDPLHALKCLIRVVKKRGSITVIEGDHGSAFYHPKSTYAQKTIQCLINIQQQMGGNSLIGRELYPLLKRAGLKNINVSPRFVYADHSKPHMVEGFTKKTFNAMVEGVKDQALKQGMISETDWLKGIEDLYKTAEETGTFCYTFFKAIAYA